MMLCTMHHAACILLPSLPASQLPGLPASRHKLNPAANLSREHLFEILMKAHGSRDVDHINLLCNYIGFDGL